jgi:hypothetical protein
MSNSAVWTIFTPEIQTERRIATTAAKQRGRGL